MALLRDAFLIAKTGKTSLVVSGFSRKSYLTEGQRRLLEFTTRLTTALDNNQTRPEGKIKEETLRLAVVASGFEPYFTFTHFDSGEERKLSTFGARYLSFLRNYFSRFPRGHLAALDLIAQAFSSACGVTKEILAGYLIDKSWHVHLDLQKTIEIPENFAVFLHRLLETLGEKDQTSIKKEAERIINNFLVSTTIQSPEGISNPFLARIATSPLFTNEEKLILIKYYLLSLKRLGVVFKPELSKELLFDILQGKLAIVYGEPQQGGDVFIEGTSEVIGSYKDPKRHRQKQEPTREGVIPQERVIFEEKKEELVLSREQKIENALRNIFPKELRRDEEFEKLESQIQELWSDLDPGSDQLKRIRTLNPTGNRIKLLANKLIRAPEDFYPHLVFSSDIGGRICLSPDLSLSFFINNNIDNNGGLGGEVANLANQDKISFDLYWQLNHLIVLLAHKLLVGEEKELKRRIEAVMENATEEIMTSKSRKGRASLERIKEQLTRSHPYLLEIETIGKNGSRVTQIIVDEDRVKSELSPGESMRIYQPLTSEEIEEGKRRKGKARPNAVAGGIVLLPYGHSPRRTAIENAEANNIPLIMITEFYWDPDLDIVTKVVIKTTFRSATA